jgi:hypothetical protein
MTSIDRNGITITPSPSITGIPAKAGIRCSKITSPQTKSDLSDYT